MGTHELREPASDAPSAIPFDADLRVSAASARQAVRALAQAHGFGPEALTEWSSLDASDGQGTDLPALYYAALLPSAGGNEMPLGLGETAEAALADLLWSLGGPLLCAALAADDPSPATSTESEACEVPDACTVANKRRGSGEMR